MDRILTVALVGRRFTITSGTAVASVLTGAFIVTVLVIAATGGVTP